MKRSSCLSIVVLAAISLSRLDANSPEEPPPLFWPDNQLIPIQISTKDVMSDGLEFNITEFANSALPLYSTSLRNWDWIEGLTHRRASAAFSNRKNPHIKSGISLIRAETWLGDLTSESLNRYVAGIQNLNPNRFTLLNADTNFAPLSGSGFLAGQPYKLVHYQIVSKEDPNSIIEIRDFISKVDDILVVVSFESPDGLASRNSGMALNLLTSLTKLEDLE